MKLKLKVDSKQAALRREAEELRQAVREAQEKVQLHYQENLEVFEEMQSYTDELTAKQDEFKLKVREVYANSKQGEHIYVDDDFMSVKAGVKFGAPTLDVTLARTFFPKLDIFTTETFVDPKKVEKALAKGLISEDDLPKIQVPGERQTTAITVKFK